MPELLRVLDNRFKPDDDGNKYFLVFCARKSDNATLKPGHAFVVWGKEDAGEAMSSQKSYGFYPDEGAGLKAIFSTVPGHLVNEATKSGTSLFLTARIIISVNRGSYETAAQEIEKWATAEYNLYQKNCISFAQAIAGDIKLLGFDADVANFPPEYFERLILNVKSFYGGNWKSTDATGRFSLKIAGPDVDWTENGNGALLKSISSDRSSSAELLKIERANTDDVLAFLGFSDKALRAEILAKNPEPSYILIKREGAKLVGEWHGLLVKKLANGRLDQIVQPGKGIPKFFDFSEQ